MNASQFKRIATRYLLPKLPGMALKGRLIYASPVDQLLCGYYFETSAFNPSTFVVIAFVQPLYVPFSTVSFTFGRRLSGASGDRWWDLADGEQRVMSGVLSDIEAQGPPILAVGKDPLTFARTAPQLVSSPLTIEARESIGYSYLAAGEYDLGRGELEAFIAEIPSESMDIPWVREMRERAVWLLAHAETNPASVATRMSEWRDQTLRAIKIIK
jgi:hypothetical protein